MFGCLGRVVGMTFHHFSIRADAFERAMVEWVSPLEMP
jgi:hypothetical protein